MVRKLLERFIKKNLLKTNQEEFRIEKVIKKKGNKLCVKWKDRLTESITSTLNFIYPFFKTLNFNFQSKLRSIIVQLV